MSLDQIVFINIYRQFGLFSSGRVTVIQSEQHRVHATSHPYLTAYRLPLRSMLKKQKINSVYPEQPERELHYKEQNIFP